MVDDLLLLSEESLARELLAATAAATEVRDDVVEDEGEASWLLLLLCVSETSSMELWTGDDMGYNRSSLAWSGCSRALLGLRRLGVGD